MRVKFITSIGAAAFLAGALAISMPAPAQADQQANSGHVLIISDEINGNSVEVTRADGSAPSDVNLSGLGDDTNPNEGKADGLNGGNNNPNQANPK